MSDSEITILLPQAIQHMALTSNQMPYLKRLLKKRGYPHSSSENYFFLLSHLFSCYAKEDALPIAAITALGDGLDAAQGYWLRMDPVELRADLAAVYLMGNGHLNFDAHWKNLALALKEFLSAEDFVFHTPHPKRWYIQLKQKPQISTRSLMNMLGKEISSSLPLGPQQTYWRKLITEIQMWMHTYGQQTGCINSVWIWGEGEQLQNYPIPKNLWDKIIGLDPFIQGLAQLSGQECIPPQEYKNLDLKTGNHLISLEEWADQLDPQELDEMYIKPLLSTLWL